MPGRDFDGTRVRAVRRAKELTQGLVAEMVGVSTTAVGNWEKGKAAPDPEKLPALAAALGEPLDALFPRAGLPDLADLRCDAGYPQYRTGALIGARSHIPVSNAERGKRRLDDAYVGPLARAYGVTRAELLAAQDRSFGEHPAQPGSSSRARPAVGAAPTSLAGKINYLLDHAFSAGHPPPSDAEVARGVNSHAGAPVLSADGVRALRAGEQTEVAPVVLEGLAEVFGVTPLYFHSDEAVVRQVVEGLTLLAAARDGLVGRVAARGLDEAGVPADVLAFVNGVIAEVRERGMHGTEAGA